MDIDQTAKAVLEWYDRHYNVKIFLAKQKPELTPETSLSTGPYPWVRETGDEIMQDYFERFNVDSRNFNFLLYWPYEKGWFPNVLRPRRFKVPNIEPQPLTLNMLIASAKAGYWMFPAENSG